MDKASGAYRTISEVAEELDIPQHVLRFWETRFPQIRPMKRSGGRRYYRPAMCFCCSGIRRLLYGEGYTIKGVQRILCGPRGMASCSTRAAPRERSSPALPRLNQRAALLTRPRGRPGLSRRMPRCVRKLTLSRFRHLKPGLRPNLGRGKKPPSSPIFFPITKR